MIIALYFAKSNKNNRKNYLDQLLSVSFGLLEKISRSSSHIIYSSYRELRDLVIEMVLATDMAYHFDHLGHFKGKITSGGLPLLTWELNSFVAIK